MGTFEREIGPTSRSKVRGGAANVTGMDEPTLLRVARDRALELPGSAASHPFGPDTEVMKVQGKLFAVFIDHDGRRLVNVKARPEDGAQLRAALPAAITPGYHMDKRHWLSLAAHPDLDEQLVRDLVTESYLLIVAKLDRKSVV